MRQDLLAENVITILKGVCWYPPKRASWEPNEGRLRISFEPDPRDMRLCMGVDGSLIKGLQFIGKSIGQRNGYTVSIGLVQNYEGDADKQDHQFRSNPRFDIEPIVKIIGGLLASAIGEEIDLIHVFKGDNLEMRVEATEPRQEQAIMALEEALKAYGYRNGIVAKISAVNPQRQRV